MINNSQSSERFKTGRKNGTQINSPPNWLNVDTIKHIRIRSELLNQYDLPKFRD